MSASRKSFPKLNAEEKEILFMEFYIEMTANAIAKVMKMPVENVMAMRNVAVRKLRDKNNYKAFMSFVDKKKRRKEREE